MNNEKSQTLMFNAQNVLGFNILGFGWGLGLGY